MARNSTAGHCNPFADTTIILLLMATTLFLAAGCRHTAPAQFKVRRGTFTDRFLLTGELETEKSENITVPLLSEWRTQITWMVRDGSRVRKGEKILELDYTSLASDLEEKKLVAAKAAGELKRQKALNAANRNDAEPAVEKTQVDYEKAKIDAAVPADIFSREKYKKGQLALYGARAAYEKAGEKDRAFQVASEAELKIKRLTLEKARRSVSTAEKAMANMVIYAPQAGIVSVAKNPWQGRKFQIGDTVFVGWTIMKIPNLSMMRVDAMLSDVDEGRIQVGMKAICTLDAFPGLQLNGYVSNVASVAEEIPKSPQ